jgi:hypothetical protein
MRGNPGTTYGKPDSSIPGNSTVQSGQPDVHQMGIWRLIRRASSLRSTRAALNVRVTTGHGANDNDTHCPPDAGTRNRRQPPVHERSVIPRSRYLRLPDWTVGEVSPVVQLIARAVDGNVLP